MHIPIIIRITDILPTVNMNILPFEVQKRNHVTAKDFFLLLSHPLFFSILYECTNWTFLFCVLLFAFVSVSEHFALSFMPSFLITSACKLHIKWRRQCLIINFLCYFLPKATSCIVTFVLSATALFADNCFILVCSVCFVTKYTNNATIFYIWFEYNNQKRLEFYFCFWYNI